MVLAAAAGHRVDADRPNLNTQNQMKIKWSNPEPILKSINLELLMIMLPSLPNAAI